MNEKLILEVEVKNRQASDAFDRFETQMNSIRRETLLYRDSISRLNIEFAENRRALLTANDAQKTLLETRQRAIRINQSLLQAEKGAAANRLANLTQQRRELLNLEKGFQANTRASGTFRQSLAEMGGTLGAIAVDRLVFEMVNFGKSSVDAAVKVDAAKRAFEALTGSTKEAEIHLEAIFELSDKPGLKFESALQGAQQLKAIGVPLENIKRALTEFGNAAAFSGGQTGEFERAMLGFRQIIQRGRVSQEELNQLTESLTLLSDAIKKEFGTTLAEEIQEQLDNAGQDIDDFVERILSSMERMARFDEEAAAIKFQQLETSIVRFKAAVGEDLTPILASGAAALKRFLDTLRETDLAGPVATLGGLTAALGGFAAAMKTFTGSTGLAGVGATVGKAFAQLGSQAGLAGTALITLGQAWSQIYSDFQKTPPFEDAVDSIQKFNIETSQTAKGLGLSKEAFASFSQETQTEIGNLLSRADELRKSLRNAINRGDTEAAAAFREEYREISKQLEAAGAAGFKTKSGIQEATKAIDALGEKTLPLITTTENMVGVLSRVDTRFLTFHERGKTLKDTIPALSDEITGLSDGFGWLEQKASNIPLVFGDIKKTAEQGLFDVVQSDIDKTNEALEKLHGTAIQARLAMAGFTDISGPTVVGDFTKSDAYRHEPVDIDTGGRRSHLQSPLSALTEKAGSLGDALADTVPKVREFEEKTDISSDVLDQFNAQAQYTAEELEEIQRKELSDFGDSLGNIVGAIDNLGPILEGVGIDITSQRSHGNLALNTAAGAGQVLSGDVIGGLTNIMTAMWEWGQPDRDALRAQHEDALAAERARVQKIQSELDFYDLERDRLFAARLEFLRSGESTFEDWMETLKSFSDNDLVRGKQVFSDFTTAMNAYNDAVNQARLDLPPLPSSSRYNAYQRAQDYQNRNVQPSAENIAEYESYGGVWNAGEDPSVDTTTPEATATSSTQGGSDPSQASTPPTVDTVQLGDVHRFTGGQSGQLKTLEGTLKEKRADFIGISDADFSTILDGYEAYTRAILDIYNAKMGFVQSASNIDGQAKTTAMTLALQEYHSLTFRANRDLEAVMGKNNLRLVNEFGATTGAFTRNQVIKGVPEGDTTQSVKADEPEMQTVSSADGPQAQPLGETHRFTSAQSGELRNIEGRAKQAATDFRNLNTQDFSEILTAYGNYTTLLQELYDKRVEFINAAHITEGAKATAREAALIAFQDDTYTANQILARVMANADLRLVNEFDSTTGIIPRNQVIKGVMPGDEHSGVVRADPSPTMKTVGGTTVKPSSALEYNALQRAERGMSHAPDAASFEIARGAARTAADTYYRAEQKVIEASGLTGTALQDKLEDNEFRWEAHLRKIDTATNTYAEKAKQALETAHAERLKSEEQLQADIQKLRDDEVANEENRLKKIEDLNAAHQEKLTDIEKDGIRKREDIGREFDRNLEDILREAGVDESFFTHGDFARAKVLAQLPDTSILDDFINRTTGVDLSDDQLSDIRESGIERRRDLDDQAIQESRAIDDATADFTKSHEQILTEAEATALALSNALAPLLTGENPTAQLEATTAEKDGKNAITLGATAEKQAATAETEATTATKWGELTLAEATNIKNFDTSIEMFQMTVEQLPESVSLLTATIDKLPNQLLSSFSVFFDRLESILSHSGSGSGGGESIGIGASQPQTHVQVFVDSEQIVTPRFANAVTDQQSLNAQNNLDIR